MESYRCKGRKPLTNYSDPSGWWLDVGLGLPPCVKKFSYRNVNKKSKVN
jgi:hypothetical protein